ncbi:Neuropeptide FF receptor 2 [Blomia tropicalis]|nr:Neuropeptide FF receptor 2 [Blomia tropicalis]
MGRHGDIVVPRREEKEDVPLLIDAMEHVHNLVTASLPIKMSSTTTTNVHQMNRTEIIVQDRTISSNLITKTNILRKHKYYHILPELPKHHHHLNRLAFVTAASITILAVDKCQSIGVKHNYRITNVFSVGLLSKLIWLIAILLSIPNMMYGETSSLVSDSGRWSTTMCRVDLSPLVTSSRSPIATIVHPCVLLLYVSILYVGPLMIIIVSHCKTYLYIFHNSHHHSHAHDLQKRIRTSDREAVRMLSVVATTFTITWLPLHVVQVVSQMAGMLIDSNMTDQQTRFWSMCYMVTRLIALLSLCLTPILFVTFNRSAACNIVICK